MALVTTIAGPTSDSYATLAEADAYLERREAFEIESWFELSEDQKERRMRLAALMLDSLPLRGVRATLSQALAFPRIFPGSPLWPTDPVAGSTDDPAYRYRTWSELEALAEALDVDLPEIPDAVKYAQIEIAFFYAHYLFSLSPSDGTTASGSQVSYVLTGDFAVSLKSGDPSYKLATLWQRDALTPGSVVYYMLKPYIGKIRGFSV